MQRYFYSLSKESVHEIIINKSRFISNCFSVSTEEEALERISKVREKFPDASHHCYAYTVGLEGYIQRFSDDGEPGGTAGMPILQVIQQQDVKNTLIVVTRYFGGIKLGAGGLVRAYSKAAAEGMEKAGKVRMTLSSRGDITLDYTFLGTMEYFLKQKGIPVLNAEYLDKVKLSVITSMEWEDFARMVTELCNGKVSCEEQEKEYYAWER